MLLTVYRNDLKSEYKDIRCSSIYFEHFLPEVQDAITLVGEAQFQEYDGSNYNAIYPSNAQG